MFQVRAKHLFFNTNHILTSPALQPRKHLRSPCFPYTFPVVCLLHLEFQGASRDATWNECTTGGDLQHARGLAAVSFEDIVFRIWMNHGIMAWYSQLHWASESHHLDSLLLVICSMLFALCHQPTVSARSGRNPAVRECSDLPQEFQIWLRQWLAWRYLLGLTFMVSSSFDIGLEKESSKHLNRERESKRERLSVPIANFFHEIYHPWHPYIDTYDTPQLYHTMPRMTPRISVFLFTGKERMGWTCTLYRDASQVPYGHHWQATAACGTQSHGQMVSRMEGRVLFKIFLHICFNSEIHTTCRFQRPGHED